LFRQSVFGRLAGYDAERLRHDPAMRWIVGGKAAQSSAASPSQMGRFETQWLAAPKNFAALADLSGQWIDLVHSRRPPRGIVLDMDSSVSPTHGEQALPSGSHAERPLQGSRRQEYWAAHAGGPRAQQASKLETRALFAGRQGGTVARAGGNACGPLSARLDLKVPRSRGRIRTTPDHLSHRHRCQWQGREGFRAQAVQGSELTAR
jgi:hypothetical protein